MSGANLSGANLVRAKLCTANLSGVSLTGANLQRANFSEADDTWEPLDTLKVDIPEMMCDLAKSPRCRNRQALLEAIADLAGVEEDAADEL